MLKAVEFLPVVETRAVKRSSVHSLEPRFFHVAELSDADIEVLVRDHVEELLTSGQPISESIPLYGGAVIRFDGRVVFQPQCCGMIVDVNSWFEAVQQPNNASQFVCLEGHPSPWVTRREDSILVECEDEVENGECFTPGTVARFSMPREDVLFALQVLWHELEWFSLRVDALGRRLGMPHLSRTLIAVDPPTLW